MQGDQNVSVYTKKFYWLSVTNGLNESYQELVARYIGELKESNQDRLEMNY